MSYLSDLLGSAYNSEMSHDDLSTALEALGLSKSKPDDSGHLRTLLQKANGDVSKYKKLYEDTLTKEQLAEKQRTEELENLRTRNAELEKQVLVSDLTSQYLGLGYDSELAKSTAEAMASGDIKTVLTNQLKFNTAMQEKIKADLIKQTPDPAKGVSDDQTITKEAFAKMSATEKWKLAQTMDEASYRALVDGGK